MCVTVGRKRPAILAGTIVGTFEVSADEQATYYQNEVKQRQGIIRVPRDPMRRRSPHDLVRGSDEAPDHWNIGGGDGGEPEGEGDALIIPIPTRDFSSIVGINPPRNLLTDIRKALQREVLDFSRGADSVPKGRGAGRRGEVKHVQVGNYHVVLAESPRDIPDAVADVPYQKRPELFNELFDYLDDAYACPVAVACFARSSAFKSDPIGFRFKPKYKGKLLVYMTEAHGELPNIDERVRRDHTVFVGSYQEQGYGEPVSWTTPLPASIRPYVLDRVSGFNVVGETLNGDLVFSVKDLKNGVVRGLCATPPNMKPSAKRAKIVLEGIENTFREVRV